MPCTRVRLNAFGGPEELELETVADLPEPSAGEVRIRVLVTSAAFTDVMIRKGMYPDVKDKPPFTPGYDMVGIVDATGPGAARFTPGDRVADLTTIGAYAEYICLPEDRLTTVPEGVSDVDALGMILSAVTPYQMLHPRGEDAGGPEPADPRRRRGCRHRHAATGARRRDHGLRHRCCAPSTT